jgi:deoxyribodipyrimidine photo-lyase
MKNPTVLYIVSRALRVSDNQALYAAQKSAIRNKQQLICLFNFYSDFPYANTRNMHFLLSGLLEMSQKLKDLNIPLIYCEGNIINSLDKLCESYDLKTIYTEYHVLKPILRFHAQISDYSYTNKIDFYKVNTACVVPVEETSPKLEYAAKTIRPKLLSRYKPYLLEFYPISEHNQSLVEHSFNQSDFESFFVRNKLPELKLSKLIPGEDAANQQLAYFINNGLSNYHLRNEFNANGQSYLSAYLHFGMLSPLKMIRDVENSQNVNAPLFVEEALVRRELAENYCHYCKDYDLLDGAWTWAKNSLLNHLNDKREYTYTLEQFEQAQTHDELWNKCQSMIVDDGYLHSYLRMYWAKMVLLWSTTPAIALNTLIHLNDKYMLDGRDPNGYTGIMWSVAAVHDRPWFDRPIIGLIRAMGKDGTLRKNKIKL